MNVDKFLEAPVIENVGEFTEQEIIRQLMELRPNERLKRKLIRGLRNIPYSESEERIYAAIAAMEQKEQNT